MRTLRHPGVIKVLDTVETEAYIYVATERVTPLAWYTRRKSLSEETSKWGLYTIANTAAFINDEASSVHGNIRLSSIFVSRSGEWRLGGFDVLSSMKDDEAIIFRLGSSVPSSATYAAPEVSKSGWEVLKRHPLSAVDAYGYGLLVFEVFNEGFISSDQIGTTKNIPPTMQQSYKRLLNANPKARLSVSGLRDHGIRSGGFFQTPLVKISEGIDNLGLKTETEREGFLLELDEVAEDFPEEFFSVKVLPELLKSLEFGGGGPKVFASVMKIGRQLSEDDWESRLIPVIIRLFSNPDRAIRVCLLDNLPQMIDHLPYKTVNDRIFPQMVTGFTDVAPLVREQTVKAVLTIVNKLSDRVVNGELLKHLAKTSNDEQPGIRTNTTICMGKIARNLGPNTRQKVLVAAFSRSLRDPFVHARHAALLALAATAELFNEEDCATKVLPILCPSLVDKEKFVRDQANKALDVYLTRVRKYGSNLADTALPPSHMLNGTATRVSTPQHESAGWAGWAISSFTNKLGSATGAMQAQTLPVVEPSASAQRSSSVPPSSVKPTDIQVPTSAPFLHREAVSPDAVGSTHESTVDPSQDGTFDNGIIDEAWGEAADDPMFGASQMAQQSVKTPAAPVVDFDDQGEPDFEGWLKAQAQAKSKAKGPLPRGLSKGNRSNDQPQSRINLPRTTTTGSVGSGAGTRKLAITATKPRPVSTKVVDTKPSDGDDDWGDAWD